MGARGGQGGASSDRPGGADCGQCAPGYGRGRIRHSGHFAQSGAPPLRAQQAPADMAQRAIATTYSADEPERLRGPQHDAAWCDELGAWRYPEAWDMLMFGMRLGADPRTVVTTTPRPAKLIRDLVRDPICAVT